MVIILLFVVFFGGDKMRSGYIDVSPGGDGDF
jgi:hypothetical protein